MHVDGQVLVPNKLLEALHQIRKLPVKTVSVISATKEAECQRSHWSQKVTRINDTGYIRNEVGDQLNQLAEVDNIVGVEIETAQEVFVGRRRVEGALDLPHVTLQTNRQQQRYTHSQRRRTRQTCRGTQRCHPWSEPPGAAPLRHISKSSEAKDGLRLAFGNGCDWKASATLRAGMTRPPCHT